MFSCDGVFAKRLPTLRYLAIGFAFYLFKVLILMIILVFLISINVIQTPVMDKNRITVSKKQHLFFSLKNLTS